MAVLRMPSLPSPLCSYRAFHKRGSNSDLCSNDPRVPRLVVLLQELEKSLQELEPIPEFELGEIVSGAFQLFGYTDPSQTPDVIVAVLAALETHDPIPGRSFFLADSGPPS